MEIATKALKPSGSGAPSSEDAVTAGIHTSSVRIITTTSSPRQHSDTSSVISFVNPMSTSTPKNVNQPTSQPVTSKDNAQTSPSMTYPIMSLIREASPRNEPTKVSGSSTLLDSSDKTITGHKSVDFKSEPAILPISSTSHSSKHKTGSSSKSEKSLRTATDISSQKSAARAAFFSSLSSPTTPTTTTSSTSPLSVGMPNTDSPTDAKSKTSSGTAVSPFRGIPSLVRSSAVSMPYSSVATSVTRSQIPSVVSVNKPSSLPVSGGSSVVSSQKFSPASPSSIPSVSSSSRSKTAFTAIPKPYSPTKTLPSPLTPESPKYRIPTPHIGDLVGKKTVIVQSTDTSNKKVFVTQFKDSGAKPKKVPPPPPPRKSSRLPGHAVLAVNAATLNGTLTTGKSDTQTETSISSGSSQVIKETIIDPPKEFATPALEKSKSSSDKHAMSKKLSKTNFDHAEKPTVVKDLSLDSDESAVRSRKDTDRKQSETRGSKPSKTADLKQDKGTDTKQGKLTEGEKTKGVKSEESTREEITGSKDKKTPIVNGDRSESKMNGNSNGSSSSSSSLDSQHEVVWLKREGTNVPSSSDANTNIPSSSETKISVAVPTSAATASVTSQSTSVAGVSGTGQSASPKKPKPQPPERRSSLTSKTQTDSYDPSEEDVREKTVQPGADGMGAKPSKGKQEPVDKRSESKSKSSKKNGKDSGSEVKERKV